MATTYVDDDDDDDDIISFSTITTSNANNPAVSSLEGSHSLRAQRLRASPKATAPGVTRGATGGASNRGLSGPPPRGQGPDGVDVKSLEESYGRMGNGAGARGSSGR